MRFASICKRFVVRSRGSLLSSGFLLPGISLGCTRTHVCVCELALVQAHTARLQQRARATRRPARRWYRHGAAGGPPLGRAMAWPWPLACKVRSGALGGKSCMSTPKEPTFGRGGIFSERFSAVSRRVRCAAAMKGYSHSASTKGRVAPTNIRTGAAATTVCYAALPSRTRNVE